MALENTRTAAAVLAASIVAATAATDDVLLRGGGRVSGLVVERGADAIVVETGPGRITLPVRLVERIVEGRSPIEAYHERAASLAASDVEGWIALARWAADRRMATLAREAWLRALAADPSHPSANAALGRAQVDGVWMGEDEAYRARGYVPFDGRWVTPAEHEALVREREEERESDRQRRETDRRVREAEERAREAEGRAREAEAAQQPAEGIPYWGWGGGALLLPVFDPLPLDQPATVPLRAHPRPRSEGPRDTRPAPRPRPPGPRPAQAGVPLPPAPPADPADRGN
jgi:hypothetical protein